MTDTEADKKTYNKCKKRWYKSRKVAKAQMRELNKKPGFKLKAVYKCRICQGFHLTSKSKKDSRAYTRMLNKII